MVGRRAVRPARRGRRMTRVAADRLRHQLHPAARRRRPGRRARTPTCSAGWRSCGSARASTPPAGWRRRRSSAPGGCSPSTPTRPATWAPTAVRMVATSATRDAANRADFEDDGAWPSLGQRPDVVTGPEEAELSFLGATASLDAAAAAHGAAPPRPPFLVVDIGGGSTEFVLGDADGRARGPLGRHRLRAAHRAAPARRPADGRAGPPRRGRHPRRAGRRSPPRCRSPRRPPWSAWPGSVTTVAALALGLPAYDADAIHGSRIAVDAVREVTADLLAATRERRAAHAGDAPRPGRRHRRRVRWCCACSWTSSASTRWSSASTTSSTASPCGSPAAEPGGPRRRRVPRHPHAGRRRARRAGVRDLAVLDARVSGCRACPRLVAWREEVARVKRASFRDEDYWGRPVPGLGPADARIAVVGLAPGRARRQPHRPRLHRRPQRRLDLRRALAGGAGQPADVHPHR